MTNTQVTRDGRIYLQVGYCYQYSEDAGGETKLELEDGVAPIGRQVIKTQQKPFVQTPYSDLTGYVKSVLLAVYETSELTEWDRRVIAKHRLFGIILEDGTRVNSVGFTYNHFFETLRARKLRLLGEKGMLEIDDGTIFGTCSKTIVIPEKVIPAHDYELRVEWDDWNDQFETDESFRSRD
jgi:hypothetical protein